MLVTEESAVGQKLTFVVGRRRRLNLFGLQDLLSQYRSREALREIFLSRFHNLCVHMHVPRIKS